MSEDSNWHKHILPLPRPEYAKQTEALLTALLWHSQGSSLSTYSGSAKDYMGALAKLPRKTPLYPMKRLIPLRGPGGSKHIVETMPLAQGTNLGSLVDTSAGTPSIAQVILNSILAPRARGDRSFAVVPVHPDVVVLQTLDGLVNKPQPANLALAIETVGWLGGAANNGDVARQLLSAMKGTCDPDNGLEGFVQSVFPLIAAHTWSMFPSQASAPLSNPDDWKPWPGVSVRPHNDENSSNTAILANYPRTPFAWFWSKWKTLCRPDLAWYEVLPPRRFVDWALALLRTGLAFTYLWEAEFYVRLHECVAAFAKTPTSDPPMDRFKGLLHGRVPLATIEHPSVPASQKHAWNAIKSLINRGYVARTRVNAYPLQAPEGADAVATAQQWIMQLDSEALAACASPLRLESDAPDNILEFLRYLLRPRSSDDDSADQADFYYLAQTNSKSNLWFQPGPEWLVVVTSLLCGTPGSTCTLRMLVDDLASLGIKVERSVLVGMLEEAGLSLDSPDADDALVIRSGF